MHVPYDHYEDFLFDHSTLLQGHEFQILKEHKEIAFARQFPLALNLQQTDGRHQ